MEARGTAALRSYIGEGRTNNSHYGLKAFGRRSDASFLYIGHTEALYIRTRGVGTCYLYIGEGGRGISKNIFFMSARDSSILALHLSAFMI